LSTVAEIAGADSPKSNLGQSFSSQLFGAETNGRDHLYLAYRDVQRAVRRGQYKYIEYRVDGKRTSQLFDLDSDPWETNDLIFDENLAPLVSDLQQCLYQYESEERAANNEFGLGFW
jgi:arylsulfatase A-like enzyme